MNTDKAYEIFLEAFMAERNKLPSVDTPTKKKSWREALDPFFERCQTPEDVRKFVVNICSNNAHVYQLDVWRLGVKVAKSRQAEVKSNSRLEQVERLIRSGEIEKPGRCDKCGYNMSYISPDEGDVKKGRYLCINCHKNNLRAKAKPEPKPEPEATMLEIDDDELPNVDVNDIPF